MKTQGTYETDLGIGKGWIHLGQKDGQPFSQLSFIDIGDMNNDCETTQIDGQKVNITVLLNGMPSSIQLDLAAGNGSFDVPSIHFHKDLQWKQVSELAGLADHHVVVPEPNIRALQAHQEYTDEPVEGQLHYALCDSQVLDYAKKVGIEMAEPHRGFAGCLAVMDSLCHLIQQDGVNYTHDQEHCGTVAQIEYALQHNHHTNCRGIAMILAGLLRACGYRASAVECRPIHGDVHVVCEAFVEELAKWVMLDPTNDLVFYRDQTPLSLIELRHALIDHADLHINENANRKGEGLDMMALLAFMSNKLFYFVKAIDSCEDKDLVGDNTICLTAKDLIDEHCPWKITTDNIAAFYQKG